MRKAAHGGLRTFVFCGLWTVWVLGACATDEQQTDDPADIESVQQAARVDSYLATGCSTAVVAGLSRQIAEQIQCVAPGSLVPFAEGGGVVFNFSNVLPYLTPGAKEELEQAGADSGLILVNSAFRTVAQQYLLYAWYLRGRCGIPIAATPGRSNHESGRAVDVQNYGQLGALFPRYGWVQTVPGDPVHFDHVASPDLRGADILAFQRLWNRNNPGDPIGEDGQWGPATEARLAAAPAEGFAISGCEEASYGADLVLVDAPAQGAVGDRPVVRVDLRNTGNTTWTPTSTFLATTDPMDHDSVFYDVENWESPSRATGVDAVTPPGAVGSFSFVANLPPRGVDTVVVETFGLVEEGAQWFGPQGIRLEILVEGDGTTPPDDGPPGGDPGDPGDPPAPGDDDPPGPGNPADPPGDRDHHDNGVVGGCAASGASHTESPPALLIALALLVGTRRRRR